MAQASHIHMLVHNSHYTARQYPLQNNRIFVQLHDIASDADDSRHPSTSFKTDPDGSVNYYQLADAKAVHDWKEKLGAFAAEYVIRPKMLAEGRPWTGNIPMSTLLSLPQGYQLFVHFKGDRKAPRKDYYLYGSRHVTVFRSPAEFNLHLRWLMHGMPTAPSGRPRCGCVYCDDTVKQSDLKKQYPVHAKIKGVRSDPRDSDSRLSTTRRRLLGKAKAQAQRSAPPKDIPFKDYSKLALSGTVEHGVIRANK